MRNANKYPEVSYSAMAREAQIRHLDPGPDHHQKLNNFFRSVGPINHDTKFQLNWLISFAVILHTDRMSDRQTNLIV